MHSWAVRASLLLLPGATGWTYFHRKIILLHVWSLSCLIYLIFFSKLQLSFWCQEVFVIFCGVVCETKLKAANPINQQQQQKTDPDADMHTCVNVRVHKTHLGNGNRFCWLHCCQCGKKVFLLQLLYKHTSCTTPSVCFHGYLFTCLHLRSPLELFLCYVENLSSFILSS